MRGLGAALIIVFAIVPSALAAMNVTEHHGAGQCVVVGADKLLSMVGGRAAICTKIEQAIAVEAPSRRYSVEVKVLSPARLSATLVVDGHQLPEQNFAVMDRNLSESSIERFAASLATVVAQAATR